jgi:hypothetical protein
MSASNRAEKISDEFSENIRRKKRRKEINK